MMNRTGDAKRVRDGVKVIKGLMLLSMLAYND